MRVTGYKRGPRMYAIVFGGILAGLLIAAAIYVRTFYLGFGVPEEEFPMEIAVLRGADRWARLRDRRDDRGLFPIPLRLRLLRGQAQHPGDEDKAGRLTRPQLAQA